MTKRLKTCNGCGKEKPLSEFTQDSHGRFGVIGLCKACEAETYVPRDPWHDMTPADKEAAWTRSLQNNHRMTVDDYYDLLDSQGGVCAICGASPQGKKFEVDHNHTTGAVRGLLCGHCNKGLGMFRDSPTALQRAISYLEERP